MGIIAGGISSVIECCLFGHMESSKKKENFVCAVVLTFLRTILTIGIAVSVLMILMAALPRVGSFGEIGSQSCGDTFTNNFFKDMDGNLTKYAVTYQVIVLTVLLVFIMLGCCYSLLIRISGFKTLRKYFKWKKKKERYEEKHKKPKNIDG